MVCLLTPRSRDISEAFLPCWKSDSIATICLGENLLFFIFNSSKLFQF